MLRYDKWKKNPKLYIQYAYTYIKINLTQEKETNQNVFVSDCARKMNIALLKYSFFQFNKFNLT